MFKNKTNIEYPLYMICGCYDHRFKILNPP